MEIKASCKELFPILSGVIIRANGGSLPGYFSVRSIPEIFVLRVIALVLHLDKNVFSHSF